MLAGAALAMAANVPVVRADERPAAIDPATPDAALEGSVTVAAASSLRTLWPRLEDAWAATLPGVSARPSFGASRLLGRQIDRGAPFELLLAADEASVERLSARRADPADARVYAVGRLALVQRGAPSGEPGDGRANDPAAERLDAIDRLTRHLDASAVNRLAIPNPEHAPYGVAAREALNSAGAWPLPSGRLVVGENATQTLQFVLAGAVDIALVPWSLVASEAPPGTRATRVTATRHAPIVHRLVTVRDASPAALGLARWLLGEEARAVFADAGLDAPPDTTPGTSRDVPAGR